MSQEEILLCPVRVVCQRREWACLHSQIMLASCQRKMLMRRMEHLLNAAWVTTQSDGLVPI